jgi:hypothetical protein
VIALLLATALADDPTPLTAHAGHATTLGRGHGVVGLFRPWAVGVSDRVDLGTTGLGSLVSPRLEAKVSLAESTDGDATRALALTAGATLPSIGLSLLRGSVLSSDPMQSVGFAAVGDLGLVGTLGHEQHTTSLGVELRAGGMTGDLWPVDLPFVGAMLAPLTEGPVVRVRWVTDYGLTRRLVLTTDVAVQLGSGGPDAMGRVFLLGGLSDHVALGAGWAVAAERLSYGGRDSLGFPLADVQARW